MTKTEREKQEWAVAIAMFKGKILRVRDMVERIEQQKEGKKDAKA